MGEKEKDFYLELNLLCLWIHQDNMGQFVLAMFWYPAGSSVGYRAGDSVTQSGSMWLEA